MSNTSVVYLSSLLRSCIPLCAISPAKQIHAQVLVHGFLSNVTLQTDLLLAYSKCGLLQDARQVFDKMTERRSMHSWNILIASYTQSSMYHDALSVFNRLMEMGIQPDHYTLPPVFMACIGIGDSYLGKALHGWVIGLGFQKYVVVGTSILDFYVKCGNFEDAHRFFVEMPCKDTVVWNSMISGMGRAGLFVNAFMYLRDMLWEGVKMDSRTIPSILNACGGHGDLMKGREVHGQVLKNLSLHKDVAVENSLIDMYAKCGCLHYSEKVFDNMHDLNLVTWTTMISCYGVHGKGEESLVLFKKMGDYGFKPNSVTLTAILASCSHSGLLVQGRKIFNSICLEYDIERSVEHYACMVNLLGRFGYLEEAFELTKNVKLTTAASVWGALLAGCMMQRNVEIGEIAAHRLFELEPRNSSNYVALCNIYDSQGIRDGVSRIRAKMRELGLVKAPGCSWITIAGKVHKFYQGDLSHPSAQMILETLQNFQAVDVFVEKSVDCWSHLTKCEVKHSSRPNISNPTKLFPVLSATTNYGRSVLCVQSRSMSSSTSSPVPTHDHISHLILDQKSASQALQTFRWASKLPSFTHSQSTYRALIHKLCTFRRFDTVKDLLDEMPRSIGSPPDEDIFITIVRGLGRSRMIKQVINVLDLVSRFEKKPSLKLFNSILDVLVKEDIDLAREFYRKKIMGSGLQGDDYTYGILMKGLCLTNRIGDGFKLLQAMKSRGVTPNTVIYNTLIHALCKNGKVGRARSFMNEMSEPNGVTFNILISAYCGEENLVQALVLLDKSFNREFVPDVVTVTKVLQLLCSEGRVKEGLEVLERVESKGGAVDVVAYNTLIKGFCKLGKVKVGHRFLKEMESKGCLPNIDTYNVLVSGFCELGMLDSALDLFDDMKTDGIRGNFITYDTLIRGLCSRGRIEDGFKILEEMEESRGGAGGRISPYNSVIYGLYKENRLDEALEFLTKMERLFPRTVDRSLRIIGFCEEGSIENGKKVYDQLIGEGEIPSAIVYVCLIHKYCHEGSVREAFELLNEMVSHGIFPVASTFNAVVGAFCRQGIVGSASKLLEDMAGRGCCLPNAGSYNTLIDALCRKGESQKAIKIFIQMVENGIIPDHHTWSLIIHYCLISRETKWLERNNMFCVNNLLQWIVEK